ncbi:MAG: aminotransferase class IV [Gammaproteobacteria bacterium]
MTPVFLNGQIMSREEARISPLDRGFLFADAIYEVIPIFRSRLFLWSEHYHRLERSLSAIGLVNPYSEAEWRHHLGTLIEKAGGGDLAVYLQVSRGAEEVRDHHISEGIAPTVFAMTLPPLPSDPALEQTGARIVLLEDIRWHRCDIKSTALLANVLLRHEADGKGAFEALLVRDGWVTEGTSSNVIALKGATLTTPPDGPQILPGVTRELVLRLGASEGFSIRRERIRADELLKADEVWLTSTRRILAPVSQVDDHPIGSGRPGPGYRRLWLAWLRHLNAFAAGVP